MTTRHRSSQRGFGQRSQRRLTAWELGPGGDDIATLDRADFTGSTSAIIGSGATPLIPGLTIIRLHGFLEVSLTAATSARDGFNWSAGICVVSLDSFTAGVASLPNPFTDIEWPGWMWHGNGAIRTAVAGLAVGDPTHNPMLVPIESKSMRKFRLNEVIALVVAAGETGTATMSVAGMTRMLAKLP